VRESDGDTVADGEWLVDRMMGEAGVEDVMEYLRPDDILCDLTMIQVDNCWVLLVDGRLEYCVWDGLDEMIIDKGMSSSLCSAL